ncbi:MAG: hypothetical protein ACREP7_21510, partial [Lysobacter sp.]
MPISSNRCWRAGRAFALTLVWLCASAGVWAQATDTPAQVSADPAQRDGYRYYEIGDPAMPRPAPTRAGLMLVGGGDWPREAFAWMAERAGHGRVVILRASGTVEVQNEFFGDIGGIAAAQTLVFEDRRAASDPRVLEIVR